MISWLDPFTHSTYLFYFKRVSLCMEITISGLFVVKKTQGLSLLETNFTNNAEFSNFKRRMSLKIKLMKEGNKFDLESQYFILKAFIEKNLRLSFGGY